MTAGGNRSAGFTIVETMIVLAVSAALLLVGLAFVNGRQNKTQFMVAINDEKQFIEQTINETENGYYPHNQSFDCTGNGDTPAIPTFTIPGTGLGQGQNNGCTFLGKVIAYGVSDSSTRIVYPLVGNRLRGGADINDFKYAEPVALGPDANSPARWPDLSTTNRLENGLTLYYVDDIYSTAASHYLVKGMGLVVIADDIYNYTFSSGNLNSGGQEMSLFTYGSPVTSIGLAAGTHPNSAAVVNQLNVYAYDTTAHPGVVYPPSSRPQKINLCFVSGGTNQSGLITISGPFSSVAGASGNTNVGQLTVSLQIYGDATC